MGLPFFVNCSFLIQRVIYFETAPFYLCLIFLIWLTEFALKGQRLAISR